jgi:hypothetical protein
MALIKRTTKGSPLTFAEGDANLVYLESLALSGSGGIGGATTGSNTFVGNQTITGSLTVTQGITGSLLGTASFATTASYWSGSILNSTSASFATTASFALNVISINTSSFATTGSNIFVGNQIIRNGTLRLSPGYQLVWTGSEVLNDWNYAPMFNASTTGFLFSPQGIFASSLNQIFINMSGSLGVGKMPTASLDVSGSIFASNGITSTGSILGNVTALTIASNTASLDLTSGSFYTLQLVSGSNTFINPTNIRAGQTVSILVSTTGSATVSFPAIVDQPSGSAYVPTTTTGKDVLTFISFDTTNLYLANVKNLI